jgi:hypothetical protein
LDSPESLSAIPPVQSPSSSSVDEGSEGSSDDLKTADSLLQESNSRDQILNVADLQKEEQNLIPKLTASPSKTKEEISSETGQSCRRKLIVEELCYTEGSYVSALATMIQIYAKPLLGPLYFFKKFLNFFLFRSATKFYDIYYFQSAC